jgi:glycosyltransferase involved in cell wall biosynthesis
MSAARSSAARVDGASTASPRVSVVTPVFNGAKYLRTCIESVLAQSYDNWDYTIVENCSTDGSLAIAREYAEADPRIRVTSNEEFVGVIENHNRAFRSISPDAKYCKVVSADDWLYPECISKLVELAERYPGVGVVGSYAARDIGVPWGGVPLTAEVLDGREAARRYLFGELESFYVPSTVLYRADLVRATDTFFPGSAHSADVDACLRCLKDSDLGFVHQILSFERIHDEQLNAKIRELNSELLDRRRILVEFGPHFLSPAEQSRRLDEQLADYWDWLAEACLRFKGREFWRVHRDGLAEFGHSPYNRRFAKAIAAGVLDLILNPKATTEKIVKRVDGRQDRAPFATRRVANDG